MLHKLRLVGFAIVLVFGVKTVNASDIQFDFVDATDGVPLAVLETGNPDGQPILFLHGFAYNSLIWTNQLKSPELQQRYRMIAFDLRGHGASGKPWQENAYAGSKVWADDVKAIMEAKNFENPIIVAWSFGANVAMSFIRHYGVENIKALNIVASHAGLMQTLPGDTAPDERYLKIQNKITSLDLRDNIEAQRVIVELMTAQPQNTDKTYLQVITNLQLPVYARKAMRKVRLNNTDMLDALRLPILFSLGAEDPSVATEGILEMAKNDPDIHASLYEGAGHSVFLEQPDMFNNELVQFIEDTYDIK